MSVLSIFIQNFFNNLRCTCSSHHFSTSCMFEFIWWLFSPDLTGLLRLFGKVSSHLTYKMSFMIFGACWIFFIISCNFATVSEVKFLVVWKFFKTWCGLFVVWNDDWKLFCRFTLHFFYFSEITTVHIDVNIVPLPTLLLVLCINDGYFLDNPGICTILVNRKHVRKLVNFV